MFKKEIQELHFMQQIYASLFSVTNKIQAFSDERLGDLSSRQHMALIAIAHLSPEEATPKNVAAMLGTSKQNVNTLLNSLQKKGCIETISNEKDKRSINIRITQTGMRQMQEGAEISIYSLAEIFRDLTISELQTLWLLLRKVSQFDGAPYMGFEEDMTANEQLGPKEAQIMAKFVDIRGAKE